MKKFFKITLYFFFYLFIFLSIFTFVFMHTPYSKNVVKDNIIQLVKDKTGLILDIGSLHGSLVNNARINELTLYSHDKKELIRIKEAEIGYNLFSIFSDSPEINSLYMNNVAIDSLPETEYTGRHSGVHFSLPKIYISNLKYKSDYVDINSRLLYGNIDLSPEVNQIKIDSGIVHLPNFGEKINISDCNIFSKQDTIKIDSTRFTNRATRFQLSGFYNFLNQTGKVELASENIVLRNRIPELSKLFNKDDYLDLNAVADISQDSIYSTLDFDGFIRGRKVDNGAAQIDIAGKRLNAEKIIFKTGDERYTGQFSGSLDGSARGALKLEKVDLEKWKFIGRSTSLSGVLELNRKSANDEIELGIELDGDSVEDMNFDRISGKVMLVDNRFQIIDSIYIAINGSNLRIAGTYRIPDKMINVAGRVHSPNIAIFSPLTKIDSLAGRISGNFRVDGILSAPNISCQFEGQDLANSDVFVKNARIDLFLKTIGKNTTGQVYIKGKRGLVENFSPVLRQFESKLDFSGDTAFVQFLRAEGDEFSAELNGLIRGNTNFNINNIVLQVRDTQLYNKTPFHIIREQDSIDVTPVEFIFGEDSFAFSGNFVKGEPRDLLLSLDNISLSPLHLLNDKIPPGGVVDGNISYSKHKRSEINIDLDIHDLVINTMNFPLVELESSVRNDSVLINNLRFFVEENSSLEINGNLLCNFPFRDNKRFLNPDSRLDLDFNFYNFPAEYINNYIVKKHELRGELTGNLTCHNSFQDPYFNTIFKIENPGFNRIKGKYLRARGFYKNDSLVFEELDLDQGGGQYSGQGLIPLEMDLYTGRAGILEDQEIEMEFSAMTGTLPFISAPPNNNIDKITGDFFISMELSGKKGNIKKDGYFIADNASIHLDVLENSIYDLDAQGSMRDNILYIDEMKGKMIKEQAPEISQARSRLKQLANTLFDRSQENPEEKNISASGIIDLKRFQRPGYDLNIKGEDLYFRTLLAEMEGYVNGDLQVKGKDTVDIYGELEVSKMFMRKGFNEQKPEMQTNFQGPYPRYNIHAIVPSNFYISNEQMDCELSGDIWLIKEGRSNPWRYSGDLTILEGSFYYYGWEFTNLSGNIYFDPVKMNPRLDISSQLNLASFTTAQTRETGDSEEIVDVYLTGDLEKPVLQFESENYSQNDIISLIQGSEGNPGQQSSTIPGSALNVFGQYFERQIERRITQMSGLDRISFQTNDNILQNRNIDNWKLSLGQRITPNIFITYEHGAVYSKPTQKVEVEYRFDRNHSIEGNVDQDGLFGINYKIRYNY